MKATEAKRGFLQKSPQFVIPGYQRTYELPYIMGLVRQSYVRQMGDGDDW